LDSLSLSLSLSCCFPFFSGSEKKRLAFCGIIQIAVCARSFSASEEFFFIVVFFCASEEEEEEEEKQRAAAAARRRGYVAANFFYLRSVTELCRSRLSLF
jgi:hypothetical protein